ncbi:hypothetical protein LABALGNA3A7_09910 [Dellaglioa algida]|nr:hypothetical protein LABALGNA3A7_09910 [Dellaglioa algida]
MAILDEYLTKYSLTRYQVSQKSGIAATTLQNAITRNYRVNRLSIKIIIALSDILDKSPGDVLNEMLNLEQKNIPK